MTQPAPAPKARDHHRAGPGAGAGAVAAAGATGSSLFGSSPSGLGGGDSTLAAEPQRFAADSAGNARDAAAAARAAAFDVCHIGVVLRAALLVQATLAVGSGLAAATPADALFTWAQSSLAAMPALLLWLVAVCSARQPLAALARRSRVGVRGVLAGGGALAAVLGVALRDLASPSPLPAVAWVAAAVAGAAAAGLLGAWLDLRHAAVAPADARARLAQLQASIRPHFLFNTLNSAVALVRIDPARAETVLEDLAELFRTALAADQNPQAVVTLDDEIELARRYLAIEQVRFGPRLEVRWDLDPLAGSSRVPLLLLQPLVENAVRHGVEPSAHVGVVRVRTRRGRGGVSLSVDNTVPADAVPRPGSGMALANVRERLHLLHDVEARFDARRDGEVFRVRIVLPATG